MKRFLRHRLATVGAAVLVLEALIAVLAPLITPYPPDLQDLHNRLAPLGAPGHPLGTDEFGRDQLSRVMYGTRISLSVGVLVVLIAAGVGVPAGALAGYSRRWDAFISPATDLLMGFPDILLALVVVAILGPSLVNAMLAVGLVSVPAFIRITRGSVLAIRDLEFVEAAKAAGSLDGKIIRRHVLPNALDAILVLASFRTATAIIIAASLSFLGLGAQPPSPEWGAMLATGRAFVYTAPHVTLVPGLAIFVTVMAFNLLGDGLRDLMDPRLRGVL